MEVFGGAEVGEEGGEHFFFCGGWWWGAGGFDLEGLF